MKRYVLAATALAFAAPFLGFGFASRATAGGAAPAPAPQRSPSRKL